MKKQMLMILLIVVGILIGVGGCASLDSPFETETNEQLSTIDQQGQDAALSMLGVMALLILLF